MAAVTLFESIPEGTRFYVYVLARGDVLTDDGGPTPFYVGMGTVRPRGRRQRLDDHEADAAKGRRCRRSSIIRKLATAGATLVKAVDSWHDTPAAAFAREIALVTHIGRKDLGTGPLVNETDGGDGLFNPSSDLRAKMRASQLRIRDQKAAIGKATCADSLPKAIAARKRRWRDDAAFREQVYRSTQAGQRASRATRPEIHAAANASRKKKCREWAAANSEKIASINAMGRRAAAEWRQENPALARAALEKGRANSLATRKRNPDALVAEMCGVAAIGSRKRSADLPERHAIIERCMALIGRHALDVAPISKKCWSPAWAKFEGRLHKMIGESRGAGT